ncbi:MAG: rhodanese-like domain-containing protein [Usitatibacter sp.]
MSGPGKGPLDGAANAEPPETIWARADERKPVMGLPYAGAVTPAEAWALQELGAARIVDVRTPPEWQFVGHVPEVPLVEWPRDGEETALRAFLAKLKATVNPATPILFLCRSGVRSHHAAELATQAGFAKSYNVLEGFEGDAPGRGWRAAGLPWKMG